MAINSTGTTNGVSNGLTNGDTNGHVEQQPLPPIQATEAYRNQYPLAYELSKLPFDTPRRLKIIVAGAGASALSLAHAVETGSIKNIDLSILEKNAGLGGTWYENRYPGCACDIPSHNYLVRIILSLLPSALSRCFESRLVSAIANITTKFTWAPNPKWSSFYVSAPEILEYLEDVADKFHLNKYINTRRKVIGARWIQETQKWQVISKRTDGRRNVVSSFGITDGEIGEDIVEECDIFINAR
jgi:cation diffusion facilitator CzcD-associated flavoprotein CzcO